MRKSTLAFVCAVFFSACAWGDGSGTQTPPPVDAAPSQQPVCGDGTCSASEVGNCPSDCGTGPKCGNGSCESGESNATCPADCPPAAAMCGDGTCNGTEDSTTCPGDCPVMGLNCMDPNTLITCFPCIIDPTMCTPECAVCFPP